MPDRSTGTDPSSDNLFDQLPVLPPDEMTTSQVTFVDDYPGSSHPGIVYGFAAIALVVFALGIVSALYLR
ncbi:hypothetical protein [Nocardia sp. NPDC020380]|uniref:hypothetical protein n=1 Tax=Nocardia sp. NPDC020380 TaxID=3364309 RepID=UPI003798ABEB